MGITKEQSQPIFSVTANKPSKPSSHISQLKPPPPAGIASIVPPPAGAAPAASTVLADDDAHETELPIDDDEVLESDMQFLAPEAPGTTGVHRRASLPPPLPEAALRRSSRAPTVAPEATATRARVSTPPPMPPPMPIEVAALRAELQQAHSRCQKLLSQRARLEQRYAEAERELSALRQKDVELQELRLANEALRLANEALTTRSATSGPEALSLSAISGIGPTFQKRLSTLGVDVRAMAQWSDTDIEAIAERIQTQPVRIRRDDWVGQARALIAAEAPAPTAE